MMTIIFYLPANSDKTLKLIVFLVFVCTTASFIAQISSFENVLKQTSSWLSGSKTVNSQGYSESWEPIKMHKKLLFNDLVITTNN